MKNLIAFCFAVAVSAVFADTFLWTGAKDGVWTDPANWTDGSGAAVSRSPGAVKDADTGVCWHNWTNDIDTAVFEGTGNGNTTIDVSGLFSIANIVIRGADTPVYTFGDALPIRSRGSFTVEAEVVNMPVFTGSIACGVGYEDIAGNPRQHYGAVDFYNKSEKPLVVGDFCRTSVNPDTVTTPLSLFYWTRPRFHAQGAGGIRITGSSPLLTSPYRLYFEFCAAPYKTTIATEEVKPFGIYFSQGLDGEIARVAIEEGCILSSLGATGEYNIGYGNNASAEITGEGVYAPQSGSAWHLAGKTLTIASGFDIPSGNDLRIISTATYGGPHIVLSNEIDNDMSGDVSIEADGATLTVPSIGAPGVKSALGSGERIAFLNETVTKSIHSQELIYSGAGETSSRELSFSRTVAGELPIVLRQQGTGEWILDGAFDNAAANGLALTLDNATEFPAELASGVVDGSSVVSITKTGSGVWRLGGICTYTGPTTVSDGSLVVTDTGSITASDVTLAAGKTLGFAASETPVSQLLKSLTLMGSGTAVLAVGAGVTLDLTALPNVPATAVLDIRAEEGAVVKCMSAKGTKLPYDAIRYNGERAAVGDDGVIASGIYPIDERVDVQGGVITSDADKIYGFQAGGTSGTVTLSGSSVAVDAIAQDLSETGVAVTIGDGQTLTANAFAIAQGGSNLTIAPKSTTGKVSVSAGGMLLDNKSSTGTLKVDAPIEFLTGGFISKVGLGLAVLNVAGGWTGSFSLNEGSLTFADDARSITLETEENPPVSFTFAATGASAALVKSAGSDSAVQLIGTSPATDQQTLEVRSGTVHITGEDTALRYYSINDSPTVAGETSRLVIDGGAKVTAQYEVFVGPKSALSGARGCLTVSNATFCLDKAASPAYQHNAVFVGTGYGNGGIMCIEEGAVVSNNLIVSGNSGTLGNGSPSAVYQRGGTVCLYGSGNVVYASGIGLGGYGYYEISGGDVDFTGGLTVGNARTSSGQWGQGVLFIGPNAEAASGELRLSYGYGDSYVLRSLVRVQGRLTALGAAPQLNGAYNASAEKAKGRADIVVDGDEACYVNGGDSYKARTYLNGVGLGGAVTLYAGTYQHECFMRGNAPNNTAPYYLNFNGGCLRANNALGTNPIHSDNFNLSALDRVTVYARGAIIDSNASDKQGANYHATLDAPLLAAPGNGVVAVALPASVAENEFVGPPFVVIDGDGAGAVAVAEFDSDAGKVTGVKVVSPGWNYTRAKAHFVTGTVTNGTTVMTAADFAPNVRGPLTKRGEGVLHCTCSNEISSVICEAGTFTAEAAGAIPSTAALDIRGGTVDMTTNILAFASLSGTNGVLKGTADAEGKLVVTTQNPGTGLSGVLFQKTNGQAATLKQTATGAWTVDVADLVAGKTVVEPGEFAFGPDATLTISGDVSQLDAEKKYVILEATAGAFEGLPTLTNTNLTNWTLRKVGGKLVLKSTRGMILIVR